MANEIQLSEEEIKDFLSARPALNKSKFSEECGMPSKQVDHFLNTGRPIPGKYKEKLADRMTHYGHRFK